MSSITKGNFSIRDDQGVDHYFEAKNINVTYESLASEDSGRTDDGVMHIEWVRSKMTKVEVTMPPIPSSVVSELIGLVQGREYTIGYWDVSINSWRYLGVYTPNSKLNAIAVYLYVQIHQQVMKVFGKGHLSVLFRFKR